MHLCISKECIYTWGKAIACQEKEGQMFRQVCVYNGGWFSISSCHWAGTLTCAPSSTVRRAIKGCEVLCSLEFLSDAEFPTCERWKRPRWRRKNLKNVIISANFFLLGASLCIHCGQPQALPFLENQLSRESHR